LQDYLPLFADQPLLFEPGTKSQYSNGGFIVLGLIIEKVTGQDYYKYVKQHVFDVAGMTDTESYFSSQEVPNRAEGYTLEVSKDQQRHNNAFSRPERGSSAGGGYSTLHDMLKFTEALKNGKLKMYSPETGKPAQGALGIGGGAPGINAALDFDPQTGNAIIVLANYDPPAAMKVAMQLRQWMKGI
jgi:CubicO group peptidase (beta-lactamase class C family)